MKRDQQNNKVQQIIMYLSLKQTNLFRNYCQRSQANRNSFNLYSHRFNSKKATMATAENQQKLDKNTSEEVWKTLLSAEEYHVLRQKGTEPPSTGKYDKFYEQGEYMCAGCKTTLYTSEQKFNSGCGWPAFYDNKEGTVERNVDSSMGMTRTEILCSNCGAHLGHVFKGEGFPTPTNERHCVNSISLKFQPKQ
eukprot:TRINITY_DN11576_c0_g1_i1.p2 TRINITY_DN11576_c0_g1~~TRINITY_DN11576_c0_g1_i1.p2  ORF type:complete len:193 (+),score=19.76 TRINITY_DN11576_c0_g1_i1:64-642(+)